jgi:hypothetical protein
MKTAVLIRPGRGSHNATESGTLARHFPDAARMARFGTLRAAAGQEILTAPDSADCFTLSRHARGDNAGAVICGLCRDAWRCPFGRWREGPAGRRHRQFDGLVFRPGLPRGFFARSGFLHLQYHGSADADGADRRPDGLSLDGRGLEPRPCPQDGPAGTGLGYRLAARPCAYRQVQRKTAHRSSRPQAQSARCQAAPAAARSPFRGDDPQGLSGRCRESGTVLPGGLFAVHGPGQGVPSVCNGADACAPCAGQQVFAYEMGRVPDLAQDRGDDKPPRGPKRFGGRAVMLDRLVKAGSAW